jgi:transposase
MSGHRYPEEFKIEAIKHMTERGHSLTDVAKQLSMLRESVQRK